MAKLVGLYTEPRVVVEHPGYFDTLLDTGGGRTSTDGGKWTSHNDWVSTPDWSTGSRFGRACSRIICVTLALDTPRMRARSA